jgi:hypothetical protein
MTEQKPVEFPVVALRQETRGAPVELILGDRHQAQVIRLRPTQIKTLALDAANIMLR